MENLCLELINQICDYLEFKHYLNFICVNRNFHLMKNFWVIYKNEKITKFQFETFFFLKTYFVKNLSTFQVSEQIIFKNLSEIKQFYSSNSKEMINSLKKLNNEKRIILKNFRYLKNKKNKPKKIKKKIKNFEYQILNIVNKIKKIYVLNNNEIQEFYIQLIVKESFYIYNPEIEYICNYFSECRLIKKLKILWKFFSSYI